MAPPPAAMGAARREACSARWDLHVKDIARYRRLFRSGLSEAILSPRALLCEGISDSVIIRGFSEIARLKSITSLDFDRKGVAFVEVTDITQLCTVFP